jgi:small-conductance mechanosensitive channel
MLAFLQDTGEIVQDAVDQASSGGGGLVERIADALNITHGQAQLILTGAVIVLLILLRWVVLTVVKRRIDDPSIWYRTRKLLSYSITLVGLVVLASIWLEASGIATYIGFLTAGLAIALSDVLKNWAGWLYIVTRRPFRVGDRVEIQDKRGDVVDIRAFRFSLLEVAGERVAAEQSTGRLLHVPNGLVFTEALANYTEGFSFIWYEIPVLITFESNWEEAQRIVQRVVEDLSPSKAEMRATQQLRATADEYRISYTHLTPTVYLTVKDSGVLLTGRLLVDARRTRAVDQDAWKEILRAFAARPDIDLAYPTVRTYFDGPVRTQQVTE